MTRDVTAWDRNFRTVLLLATLLFGALDYWYAGAQGWLRSGFVVCVAGCVGYFTNFLAIKMLFQPKRGQVLGWRGLVPKNQANIARSLGESVQQQLLSPDIVLAYISEKRLIEVSTQALADWVDANLQKPEVRREITALLVRLMNERGPELLTASFDLGEEAAKGLARNPQAVEAYWQRIRAALSEFAEDSDNREMVARVIRQMLSERLPHIATWVDHAIEHYLHQHRGVGRIGLGLKNLLSLDEDAIESWLKRFVEDQSLATEGLRLLDAIMASVQLDLASEEKQAQLQAELESWIETVSNLSRRHLLPAMTSQIGDYLNTAENWQQIEDVLIRILQWLKARALLMLDSPIGRTYVRAAIERAVQQLNVTELVEQQVMKLDTDELEKMVLDNTGGNLTIIQVLGGCLGLIAGAVQVHILFAVPIGLGVLVVWAAYRINEYRMDRLEARRDAASTR